MVIYSRWDGAHEARSYSQESQRVDGESCTIEGVIGIQREGSGSEEKGKGRREDVDAHQLIKGGKTTEKKKKRTKTAVLLLGRKEGRRVGVLRQLSRR